MEITLTPLDELPSDGPRLRRAVTYVREVAAVDPRFFGFGLGFISVYGVAAITLLIFMTVASGVTGFATALFLNLFVVPGLCAPLLVGAWSRLWVPMRVMHAHGRTDSWVHPKWLQMLPGSYIWTLNGRRAVVLNSDRTPFIGRTSRPAVSDAAIYVDLDVSDFKKLARGQAFSWEKLEPALWVLALAIAAFLLLVLIAPDSSASVPTEVMP
ncbi:MAG: hypothetical protein VW518_04310 [Burkholderiaceae bacterium]